MLGSTPPPPPPPAGTAGRAPPAQTPPPGTPTKEGGWGQMGFRASPPPPPQEREGKGSEWRSASGRRQLQTRTQDHGFLPNPPPPPPQCCSRPREMVPFVNRTFEWGCGYRNTFVCFEYCASPLHQNRGTSTRCPFPHSQCPVPCGVQEAFPWHRTPSHTACHTHPMPPPPFPLLIPHDTTCKGGCSASRCLDPRNRASSTLFSAGTL